jgi:hypothetical protein
VGWLLETKPVTQTERNYRSQFNKQPPSDYAVRDWQRRFLETGSVHDRKRSGRPGVSDECVETIRASFVQNPHVELRVNCYSRVQRYTKCYIIHNFSKPRVDFVDTLFTLLFFIIILISMCYLHHLFHATSFFQCWLYSSHIMSYL